MPAAAKNADAVLMIRRYFPILSWSAEFRRQMFNALAGARILGKRAGNGVMRVAT